ncbi:MAG: extracellular solute-binding protein [Caldisericaceae bacterium]
MKRNVIRTVALLATLSLLVGIFSIILVRGDTSAIIQLTIGSKKAYVNFKEVALDQPPVIDNGRTLVPVRFIVEALDALSDWDSRTQTVTLIFDDKEISFKVGSDIAYVNGSKFNLDVPAKILPTGRTVVPVRFVSDAIGAKVSWDSNKKMVTVVYSIQPVTKKQKVTLKVIHAGSLTQPIRSVEDSFSKYYSTRGYDITFQDQSGGSVDVVKAVSELHQEFDVVLTADSYLIPQYLVPDYANWYVEFATNKLVLCYTDKSKYASDINASNWYNILLRNDVEFGNADPNSDPCGYRTVLMFQLAEKYYKVTDLNNKLIKATKPNNIRPKSVELVALLQANELDYAFEYESVAVQNNLKYLKLPDELNLGNSKFKDFYAQANLTLKDGTVVKGAPIVYGLTIPKNAPQNDLAERFVAYLLKNGSQKFSVYGQPFIELKGYPNNETLPKIIRAVLQNLN